MFSRARLPNARKEAANLTAKNLKRIGRCYRGHGHYRLRTLVREYWNVRNQRFHHEDARQHPNLWQESKPSRVKNSDIDSKLSNVGDDVRIQAAESKRTA